MIRTLLAKDLLRRWRNPGGILILILIPLLATLMLGFLFGPNNKEGVKPRVTLMVEDLDESMASQFLVGAFSRGELAQMFQLEQIPDGTGRPRMDQGDASALLIIPPGFGDSLLAQKVTRLTLIKNPGQSFAPKIAEETIQLLAEGGDRLVRLASEPLRQLHASIQLAEEMPEAQIGAISIGFSRLIRKGSVFLSPPLITIASSDSSGQTATTASTDTSRLFAYLLAGMAMMMLLFTLDTLAKDIFHERDNRTLFRLLTTPASPFHYATSKLLFMFVAGLISQLLLWVAGVMLFSIHLERPLLFLVFLLLCTAALTGIIALIYALVRTRSQAAAILPAVIIVFSMLGGAMVPLNLLPSALKSAASFSPLFWCIDGLQRILTQSSSAAALMTHFLVLILLTLTLNLLAFTLFARKVRG